MEIDQKIRDNWLIKIERKYPWSFLGVLLAIIFGVITIYPTYFVDKRPALDYKILSNIRVLDLYADVLDLEILYKKENIIEQSKNLSILTLKIENISNIDIISSYYDPNNPLGISVLNGTIVEKPEIIDASNDYLKKNIRVVQNDSLNLITFSNTIIDRHQSFNVKLLLLHKSEENPKIQPIGKIAGIEEINVVNEVHEIKISFWKSVLQGGFGVHIARFLFYILSIYFSIIVLSSPIILSDSISTRKRKKIAFKYKTGKKITSSESTDFIFDTYITGYSASLLAMQETLRDKTKLKQELELELEYVIKKKERDQNYRGRPGLEPNFPPPNFSVDKLYRKGLIKLEQGEVIVDSVFENVLNEFVSFVELVD